VLVRVEGRNDTGGVLRVAMRGVGCVRLLHGLGLPERRQHLHLLRPEPVYVRLARQHELPMLE
jgi:hypothetical protein